MQSKVVIVDNHPLMALASKKLFEEMDELSVVGIADTSQSCLDLVELHRPNLVFLDVNLPDISGTQLIALIKKVYPDVKIIVFSGIDLQGLTAKFVELGVNGILSKESSADKIKSIVNLVLDGQMVIPQLLSKSINADHLLELEEDLTNDEIMIMTLIIKGANQDHIAEALSVSKRSVDNYQKRIYKKLGVNNKLEAVAHFMRTKYYKESFDK